MTVAGPSTKKHRLLPEPGDRPSLSNEYSKLLAEHGLQQGGNELNPDTLVDAWQQLTSHRA